MKTNAQNETPAASASRHTPEPWIHRENGGDDPNPAKMFLADTEGNTIAAFDFQTEDSISEANASRAHACVNALAGLNPEAVKEVIEAFENSLLAMEFHDGGENQVFRQEIVQARAALAALKGGAK